MTTFLWTDPPGWTSLPKVAEQERSSYPKQVLQTLPRTVVKAVSDMPVGVAEAKLEAKLLGRPLSWGQATRQVAGSSTGHLVGALTAPLFFSGIEGVQSDDAKERRVGAAKALAAGAISGYSRGAIDGMAFKLPQHKILRAAEAGLITSVPGALGALAVARSNKKAEDESKTSRYLKGGLVGMGAGAIKGGFKRGFVHRELFNSARPEFFQRVKAGAITNAAGGLAGGAVLSAIIDAFKKPKAPTPPALSKTAEAATPPPGVPVVEGLREGFEIRPHQERLVSKVVNNGGVAVAAHGVGTGKTAASVAAFDRLRRYGMAKKVLVVTPAGLKKNYADSVNKFSTYSTQIVGPKGAKGEVYYDGVDPNKTVTVVSYELFRAAPEKLMESTGADMLILDEFHKVRDPDGSTYRAAARARQYAPNFLGLTGSITNNDPNEVVPLVNLAAGRVIMRPSQFNARYKQTVAKKRGFFGGTGKVTSLRNVPDIQKQFGRYVDFLTTEDVGGDMPAKKVEEIRVPMSPEQQKIYEYALQAIDPITARKIRENLPMDYKEAAQVFTMIQKARQAANSVAPFRADLAIEDAADHSPKAKRLIEDTVQHLDTTPDGQVVLYSNLINGGVDMLSAALRKRGIDHAVFVGKDREVGGEKITSAVRNQGVTDYLAGKKRVIVVSPAGAEGLDLRNSTRFASLDGHFNPERTRQAEARARRLGGLSHRPQEKREVEVKRYFSVYPDPPAWRRLLGARRPTTTDEWIHSVAAQKHTLNTQLTSAFKQPAAQGAVTKLQDIPQAPPKYIRRWKSPTGEWRYDYTH